jgi:hypothetical protein
VRFCGLDKVTRKGCKKCKSDKGRDFPFNLVYLTGGLRPVHKIITQSGSSNKIAL